MSERRYLRISDLARFKNVEFTPRRAIDGQYSGRHASRQRGHSVEFSDYREYTPGDEIGKLDWKVYGRSDRLFIKLFEHQTDLTVNILVDASASMGYSGSDQAKRRRRLFESRPREIARRTSKYDHACYLAAAIGYLVVRGQDRVGFGVAQEGLQDSLRPLGTFGHLDNILRNMERVTPRRRARLAEALEDLSRRNSRRGVLIVLSDLLEEPDDILEGLSRFTHRGGEVIVFHVLHPDEIDLPDVNEAIFVDSESRGDVRLNVADLRPLYEKRLHEFVDDWSRAFTARRIDSTLVSTGVPYIEALEGYLELRAGRRW